MIPVIVAGLAGFWVWTVLNDEDGVFGWFTRLCMKTSFTSQWLRCPWCSGAWFAGGFSLILFHPLSLDALIVALASAAITGALGSYFQGE